MLDHSFDNISTPSLRFWNWSALQFVSAKQQKKQNKLLKYKNERLTLLLKDVFFFALGKTITKGRFDYFFSALTPFEVLKWLKKERVRVMITLLRF